RTPRRSRPRRAGDRHGTSRAPFRRANPSQALSRGGHCARNGARSEVHWEETRPPARSMARTSEALGRPTERMRRGTDDEERIGWPAIAMAFLGAAVCAALLFAAARAFSPAVVQRDGHAPDIAPQG